MIRFEHDPKSGAWYVRLREGKIEETVDLAEPGFGAHLDVDCEGNVLGVEFLSFEEYAELVARSGGTLEIPNALPEALDRADVPADAEDPRLRGRAHEGLRERLEAAVSSLSPRQQQIVRLYYYDGLRRNEIALELGISESAVSTHLKAALTALRNELAAGDESNVPHRLEKQLEEYFAGAR